MVFDLVFFLRNRFIFRSLNVAAKISFQKQEIKDFERETNDARLETVQNKLPP